MSDSTTRTDSRSLNETAGAAAGSLAEAVLALAAEAAKALGAADRTAHLVQLLPAADSSPLRVALVGPYNAGKTLLIGALLRLSNEQLNELVDSAPKTTKVTEYPWLDKILLDLPGTLSGSQEHEEQSRRGMRAADALLIVTTVELSGEAETAQIRKLLGEEGFARRAVVVINKINAENSDRAVIRTEIERRLGDYAATVPLVVTDARDYIDAHNEPDLDDSDRALLRDGSGIEDLIGALEELAASGVAELRGAAQAYELLRVVNDARAAWDLTETEEEATVISNRLSGAIERATRETEAIVAQQSEAVAAVIRTAGMTLSEAVAEKDGSLPEATITAATKARQEALLKFDEALNRGTGDVLNRLQDELQTTAAAAQRYESAREFDAPKGRGHEKESSFLGDAAGKLWPRITDWANALMKDFVSGGNRKGGKAHAAAKWLNNVFGVEAKPYAHRKMAEKLLKGARGARWATVVIGPLIDVSSIASDFARRRKIDSYRKDLRDRFGKEAEEARKDLTESATTWAMEWLDEICQELEPAIGPAVEHRVERDRALAVIEALHERSVDLIALTDSPVAGHEPRSADNE